MQKGKSHHRTTAEEVQQIITLYREGKTTSQIVAETGLTESTVGAYNPVFAGDPVRAGRVEDLLAKGFGQPAIRKVTGEPQEYVSRIARRWVALRAAGIASSPPSTQMPKIITADDLLASLRRLVTSDTSQIGWLAPEIINNVPEAPHSGEPGFRAQLDDARALMKDDSRFQRLPGGLWRPAADDAPLSEKEESNKIKLLRLLATEGQFETEAALLKRINSVPDIRLAGHEMTHVLHDLRKKGKVAFHHSPGAPNGEKLTRIGATPNGKAYIRSLGTRPPQNEREPDNGAYVGAAHEGFLAETRRTGAGSSFRRKPRWTEDRREAVTATVVAEVAPEPPPAPAASPEPEYPHLADLRKRIAQGAAAQARAEAYLAAAALLEPYESEKMMVDALVGAANDLGEKNRLSPIEAEYLAYAEAHPNGR